MIDRPSYTLVFKPGNIVPRPGQYWIRHQQHRLAHLAHIGEPTFPHCLRCGGSVRFICGDREFQSAPPLSQDRDFKIK
jgi:hypothetical protein